MFLVYLHNVEVDVDVNSSINAVIVVVHCIDTFVHNMNPKHMDLKLSKCYVVCNMLYVEFT